MKTLLQRVFRAGSVVSVKYLTLLLLFAHAAVSGQSTNPTPYCTTTHVNMGNNGCQGNYGFYFLSVELNGTTQNFSCNTGTVYRYYNSSNFTSLKRGATYTLKLKTASTVYQTSSAAWIDFGGDQSFAESIDFVGSGVGGNAPTLQYTFTVPATAAPGVTRMRIRCDYNTQITSAMYCNSVTNSYGETIDFDVEIESVNYPDLAVGSLIKPASICGDDNDSVVTTLYNFGNSNMANFPVTCLITGTMDGVPVNQTLNTTVTATVDTLGKYRLAFPTPINTNKSGTLTFKLFSSAGSDGDRTNDTFTVVKTFYGTPSNPGASDKDRCGVGTVNLSATPGKPTDVVRWYDAPSGGTLLGTGTSITSPFYYNSTTVYAEASRNGATSVIENSNQLYTYISGSTGIENGGMMDITPSKTMMINSISVMKVIANAATWKVYIRTGGYINYQNNPGAWTLVATQNNVSGGTNMFSTINIGNIVLQEGVTYGIYIQCLGTDVWCNYNPTAYTGFTTTNPDMTIVGGCQLYGAFGVNGTYPNYHMNVQFDYTTMCLSNRVPVDVTIKPVPKGTTLLKGTTFNGQFASGTSKDPDITASGDMVSYELQNPTGYSNGQYGSTWSATSVNVRTPSGTDLPSGNYAITTPSSGGSGLIQITPPPSFTDSTLIVSYIITAQGCDTFISRQLFVAPRPIAAFSATVSCEGESLSFDNNSSISTGSVSYLWRFGDGDSTVLINPDHIYKTAGTYTVDLIVVSNYGYMDMETMTVTVYENPTAEFGATNVCEGAVTPFTDGSIIPAGTPVYEWDFGDGSTPGSGPNPTHQYTTPGVYEVTMRVTANGCKDEVRNYVTYAPRAVPDFSSGVVDCNNEEVTFTNTSSLSSGQMGYSWDFGDNTSSTVVNPVHNYGSYGMLDVTLTVTTDLGCTDQVTKQINLTEAPKADFSSQMLCDKDNTTFTNTSSEPSTANTSYEWIFSDGSSYSTKNVSRSFPSIGSYTVTLRAISDNGCTDEFVRTISVDEEPAAQFYADDVCDGDVIEFLNASTGNMGNYTSSWDFGSGLNSSDRNPTETLAKGMHTVTLTITTPSGCESMISKTVMVKENPTVSNIVLESAQQGDGTMNFIAQVSPANVSYTLFWGDGGRDEGTASGGQVVETYTYLTDGKYPVRLRLDHDGCLVEGTSSSSVLRTSVNRAEAGMLKVYPNPGSGDFVLDLSALDGAAIEGVRIFNMTGQEVQANIQLGEDLVRVDLSQATPGVYLFRVYSESGMHQIRVVLNK